MTGCAQNHAHFRRDGRLTDDPEQCWPYVRSDLLAGLECDWCIRPATARGWYGDDEIHVCDDHRRCVPAGVDLAPKSPAGSTSPSRRYERPLPLTTGA